MSDESPAPIERRSWTIDEFCERNGISRSLYYKLQRQGLGPRTWGAGTHQRISDQAETDWIAQREAAGAA
jgi:hypothetical protein